MKTKITKLTFLLQQLSDISKLAQCACAVAAPSLINFSHVPILSLVFVHLIAERRDP